MSSKIKSPNTFQINKHTHTHEDEIREVTRMGEYESEGARPMKMTCDTICSN